MEYLIPIAVAALSGPLGAVAARTLLSGVLAIAFRQRRDAALSAPH